MQQVFINAAVWVQDSLDIDRQSFDFSVKILVLTVVFPAILHFYGIPDRISHLRNICKSLVGFERWSFGQSVATATAAERQITVVFAFDIFSKSFLLGLFKRAVVDFLFNDL